MMLMDSSSEANHVMHLNAPQLLFRRNKVFYGFRRVTMLSRSERVSKVV
jgi:hypothetical protein